MFPKPFADSSFGFARGCRNGFRWEQTEQYTKVDRVGSEIENMDVVWLEQIVEDFRAKDCELG